MSSTAESREARKPSSRARPGKELGCQTIGIRTLKVPAISDTGLWDACGLTSTVRTFQRTKKKKKKRRRKIEKKEQVVWSRQKVKQSLKIPMRG